MKKISLLLVLALVFSSCTKRGLTPEGPTDVKIRNITTVAFTDVFVDTGEGSHNYGDIAPGDTSVYYRFEKAYMTGPEVTLLINGIEYSTGTKDFTFATYIGPDKVIFEVFVKNDAQKLLETKTIIIEPIEE